MVYWLGSKEENKKEDALLKEIEELKQKLAEKEKISPPAIQAECEFLTQSEAAKFLDVSELKVEKLRHRGIIPAVKKGWNWRIKKSDLLNIDPELLKKRTRPSQKIQPEKKHIYWEPSSLNLDDYLTQQSCARSLGVTDHMFRRISADFKLKSIKVNKNIFFKKEDITKLDVSNYKKAIEFITVGNEEWMSYVLAIQYLGIGHTAIANWVKRGFIKNKLKLGGATFYKRSEIETLDVKKIKEQLKRENFEHLLKNLQAKLAEDKAIAGGI